MEDEIKKDFVDTMDELCSDEEIERYYGSDEDLEKLRISGEKIKIKEAKEEKSIEIAKNLLKQNLSIENISLATGLSIKEIEKLI